MIATDHYQRCFEADTVTHIRVHRHWEWKDIYFRWFIRLFIYCQIHPFYLTRDDLVSEINVPAILSKQLLHSVFFHVCIFLVYIPAKSHLTFPSLGCEIENTGVPLLWNFSELPCNHSLYPLSFTGFILFHCQHMEEQDAPAALEHMILPWAEGSQLEPFPENISCNNWLFSSSVYEQPEIPQHIQICYSGVTWNNFYTAMVGRGKLFAYSRN